MMLKAPFDLSEIQPQTDTPKPFSIAWYHRVIESAHTSGKAPRLYNAQRSLVWLREAQALYRDDSFPKPVNASSREFHLDRCRIARKIASYYDGGNA